jgi:shikimate kinase
VSDHDRQEFLKLINTSSDIYNKNVVLLNKTTNQFVRLSLQQSKCMNLLAAGYKNQQIAMTLGLSIRTVQHYIDHIRLLVDCPSSKELITLYHTKSA